MRDAKRIPIMLKEIEKVWKLYPQYRLGQLLANLYGHHTDPFYWQDEELETKIKELDVDQ